MKNEKLLFLNNKETIKGYKPDIKNSCIQVNFKKEVIGGREIMELIRIINTIEERYASTKIPIVLKLGELKFADKLTIVIFETICHYILTVRKRKIGLSYTIIKWEIWTEGIFSSPLLLLGGSEEKKFIEKYNSEIYKRHYRRVVLVELTKKGKVAHRLHERFHSEMVRSMMDYLSEKEKKVFIGSLEKLNNYFKEKCEAIK